MQPSGVFETVLYAEDLTAAERFYHEALGLEVIERGNMALVFRCCDAVLIIFDPRKSAAPARGVPSHGTTGVGHIAFAAKPEDLDAWREQLRQTGVLIERQVDWTQIEDVITEAYRLVAPRALVSKLPKT
jgi:catechol 2,3-dioxygenase-like lactoylglutathione lyase family enzyme